jgi:TnpA family transposase
MATRMLVEAQARAPIAALWGDGSTSSSDGQHFPSAGRARGVSTVNLRYGGEPGVKFYTHVSDQFAPFATRAIAATAAEAPHVLDGLLRHGGRTPIREHHTDTGGFSDHVFALCALLGYRFAPRIRDLPEKRLYVLESSPPAPTLAPLIARTARTGQICAAWPQLVQLAASIRSGQVSAAHAVTTLAATSRQSALAAAFAEVGRIERSIFTLEWMLEPDLRHRVQTGLNKGEARNNLARAVFLNRLGQMHDRTHDDQQHRAVGCNLVVAAIILWNTVYLAAAVEALRRSGVDVPDELLRHV